MCNTTIPESPLFTKVYLYRTVHNTVYTQLKGAVYNLRENYIIATSFFFTKEPDPHFPKGSDSDPHERSKKKTVTDSYSIA